MKFWTIFWILALSYSIYYNVSVIDNAVWAAIGGVGLGLWLSSGVAELGGKR